MIFTNLSLEGLVLIEPRVFEDERGFFLERYNKLIFQKNGIEADFVQDNQSLSKKNVLRGLHFQLPPKAQDKLVWVTRGKALDVAVDLRKQSSTFGKHEKVILSEDNQRTLFIPKGFAHGFLTLSDDMVFQYKVSDYYSPEHEQGFRWDDPELGIEWGVKAPIISEKDKKLPLLKELSSRL